MKVGGVVQGSYVLAPSQSTRIQLHWLEQWTGGGAEFGRCPDHSIEASGLLQRLGVDEFCRDDGIACLSTDHKLCHALVQQCRSQFPTPLRSTVERGKTDSRASQ